MTLCRHEAGCLDHRRSRALALAAAGDDTGAEVLRRIALRAERIGRPGGSA